MRRHTTTVMTRTTFFPYALIAIYPPRPVRRRAKVWCAILLLHRELPATHVRRPGPFLENSASPQWNLYTRSDSGSAAPWTYSRITGRVVHRHRGPETRSRKQRLVFGRKPTRRRAVHSGRAWPAGLLANARRMAIRLESGMQRNRRAARYVLSVVKCREVIHKETDRP
jgi:hypothetical protein